MNYSILTFRCPFRDNLKILKKGIPLKKVYLKKGISLKIKAESPKTCIIFNCRILTNAHKMFKGLNKVFIYK